MTELTLAKIEIEIKDTMMEKKSAFVKSSVDVQCDQHYKSISKTKDFAPKSSSERSDTTELVENIDEPIYAVPYGSNFEKENIKLTKAPVDVLFKHPTFLSRKYQQMFKLRENATIPPRSSMRNGKLKSIDEQSEIFDETFREFCYYDCKCGCNQKPEEVSQETFKMHWLQRLESLRQREVLLRDKEVALEGRERLLFKKEKELRILERLVKEKMQKAELYLKRCRHLQIIESQNVENERNVECRSFDSFKVLETALCSMNGRSLKSGGSEYSENLIDHKDTQNGLEDQRNVECRMSSYSVDSKTSCDSKSSKNSRGSGDSKSSKTCKSLKSSEAIENNNLLPKLYNSEVHEHFKKSWATQQTNLVKTSSSTADSKVFKNPSNSRNSLATNLNCPSVNSQNNSSNLILENPSGWFSRYGSFKSKSRPKVSYDDLNSTLSADIGDASFIITSKKFDPKIVKKPYAFTRSVSERHGTNDRKIEVLNFPNSKLNENRQSYDDFEEDKVLRRVSENILSCQDKSTKFQNYGLIDKNVKCERLKENDITNDKKYSYLNLESGNKNCQRKRQKGTNNRPVSWNEEASTWLQKKRQAYNMAIKKSNTEDLENNAQFKKPEKCIKKKDSKERKFTIFR